MSAGDFCSLQKELLLLSVRAFDRQGVFVFNPSLPLSLRAIKKKTNVSPPDFYKKDSGQVLYFLLFPTFYYFQLNAFFTHYYSPLG